MIKTFHCRITNYYWLTCYTEIMSETQVKPHNNAETDLTEPGSFGIDIQVNGLPYRLEGSIPTEPSSFDLVVSLPTDAWEKIELEIDKKASENSWFASQYKKLQDGLNLGGGKIGSIWVSAGESPSRAPTIHIDRIQTELGYLPEDSEYNKATGVGSAILDNLCALADTRGWQITLYPLERDGRLVSDDLQDWYRRRGFKFGSDEQDVDREQLYPGFDMLRFPQKPDRSQPILKVLEQ